jgi:hypothetical protein
MLIDCDTCRMRDIACGDCVISLLLGAPQDSLDLDAQETAALGALAAGGLAPPLRLVPVCRSHSPDIGLHVTGPGQDANRAGQVPARQRSAGRRAVFPAGRSASRPAVSGL